MQGEENFLKSRVVTSVEAPPFKRLSVRELFGENASLDSLPDIELLRRHLSSSGLLADDTVLFLIDAAKRVFSKLPNLVQLQAPLLGTCRIVVYWHRHN